MGKEEAAAVGEGRRSYKVAMGGSEIAPPLEIVNGWVFDGLRFAEKVRG
jgi:hypothetical protein